MNWVRNHPYAAGLLGACVLIAFGIFTVSSHAVQSPQTNTTAWGGNGTLVDASSPTPTNQPAQSSTIMQQVQSGAPYNYTIPNLPAGTSTAADTGTIVPADTSFDYNAFIAMLSQPTSPTASSSASTVSSKAQIKQAYSFIPVAAISTTSPTKAKTAVQQLLYEYGNEAGSYIQSYEQLHSNTTKILTDSLADRTNTAKAAAVQQIGKDLAGLGRSLADMQDIPPQVATAHAALAKSYQEIGANLQNVPTQQRDSDLITAIKTYDASADTFTKNYIAVALTFPAYGVTFNPDDAGSVFSFSNASL